MSMKCERNGRVAAVCAALVVCAIISAQVWGIDFLVPGIPLESLSLRPGARVSYLVTSRVFGVTDSSYVELRVLGHAQGTSLLEILSSPYPRKKEGSLTVRFRLADRATSAKSAEEFRSCLGEIRVSEEGGTFRSPTQKELDDIDIEGLFERPSDHAERKALGAARIATPSGTFLCEGAELSRKATKQVSLGGVQAEREEEVTSRVWLSRDVPFWGLVRSTVEKKSFTQTSLARSSTGSPRVTVTESILLSYRAPRGRS